jgi:hypothetical protein
MLDPLNQKALFNDVEANHEANEIDLSAIPPLLPPTRQQHNNTANDIATPLPLKFLTPLRSVGYGLLLLALFDWLDILLPSSFLNPNWELQTMGALVERVPVLLLAMALIFIGELHQRARWERRVLPILSWLTIALAVIYFLMIPLTIIDAARINHQNNLQMSQQLEQGQKVLSQVKQAAQQTKTPAEMQALLQRLEKAGITVNGQPPQNAQQLTQVKQQINEATGSGAANFSAKLKDTQASQGLTLAKKSLKWSLGALLSGTLLFILWRSTDWARQKATW